MLLFFLVDFVIQLPLQNTKMNYQKTYMNHIHSSSLLYQLATMWKTQTLCDAVIRSGSVITKVSIKYCQYCLLIRSQDFKFVMYLFY